MLEIDGGMGEGGGQVVRTSLTMSLATGTPIHLINIRANRKPPGLKQQHLTAVRAAAEVGGAAVRGDAVGSRQLWFEPGTVTPGDYHFNIGTAGSTTLVLQTVLPVLLTADGPSTVMVEGGTHNAFAPPYDFIERAYLPLVERMGPRVRLKLDRRGFYPIGRGKLRASVSPVPELSRLEVLERGKHLHTRAAAILCDLPQHIADRELWIVARRLSLRKKDQSTIVDASAHGMGNVVLVDVAWEHLTEVFSSLGKKGKRAERVADEVADEAEAYLEGTAPVGSHLADQLLVPMALGGGGKFRTAAPLTLHTTTNAEVIQKFLDVQVTFSEISESVVEVAVEPREA